MLMDFHGFSWIFVDFRGFLWIFMDFRGFSWIFVDFRGFLWIFMDFRGFSWVFVDFPIYQMCSGGCVILLIGGNCRHPTKKPQSVAVKSSIRVASPCDHVATP